MSEDEKQNESTGREAEVEQGSRKTINTFNNGLYHKVTISSWEECNPSSLQQVVQNNTFCGNNRGNISRGVSKVVQE